MTEEDDIIYTAGYTDGDGCFSIIRPQKKIRSSIIISSVNHEFIHHITRKYGGCMSCHEQRKDHWKNMYSFTKQGIEARDFALDLQPYLVEKKDDCSAFISFFDATSKTGRDQIIRSLRKIHKESNFISIDDVEAIKAITTTGYSREDLIYMAGFIDAECSLGIQRYKPKNNPNHVYKILLQFNDTKAPMFYWIKQRFGGFCCFYKRKTGRDQLTWRLGGKLLFPVLEQITPFLRFKQPVAKKLLEFYNTTIPNGGDRHSEAFKASYAKVISKRECIVEEVHNLNLRGFNN